MKYRYEAIYDQTWGKCVFNVVKCSICMEKHITASEYKTI